MRLINILGCYPPPSIVLDIIFLNSPKIFSFGWAYRCPTYALLLRTNAQRSAIDNYILFKNKELPMCSTALCSYIIIIMTINRPLKNSFTSFKRANDGLSRPHSVILLFVDIIISSVATDHL